MSTQVISSRQMGLIIASSIITAGIIIDPQQLARSTGHDAIFTYSVSLLCSFLICYFFYSLAKKFPGKHLFEITFIIAGRWAGGLINALFILNIWFIFARDSFATTAFLRATLLQRTPPEILIMLFVIVMIYYGKSSVEVTARVNEIVFPFAFVIILLFPLLLVNEIPTGQWEPLFTQTPAQLILGSMLNSIRFGDLIVFGAFLHTVQNAKHLLTGLRFGVILSAFCLTYMIATAIGVFGADILAKLNYPVYSLVAQINITDFMDRVDVFAFTIYFPAAIINVVLSFTAFIIGIAAFTSKKDSTLIARSAGWMLLLTILITFRNFVEMGRFTFFSYPAYVLAVQPPLFLLLFFLAKRHPSVPVPQPTSDNQQVFSGNRAKKPPKPLRFWITFTNGSVLFSLLLILLGKSLGHLSPWIRGIAAIGYGVCLLLALLGSVKERKRAEAS
ncbi:endospore germination permease [Paenibacillus sp. J2TS4]|uniref:GerAB/ArcD/ProY family transporter n=1 Tax=Paenibacillus sp. J2TS4 TaxID=2807194 RepID=UPI001B2E329A|nr:endospore germination permease [Paenibacillus sp. J2TS4]GIP34036.1 hypothetical protein J2TS4_32460 [Paenibacillus sp. J2TS4]